MVLNGKGRYTQYTCAYGILINENVFIQRGDWVFEGSDTFPTFPTWHTHTDCMAQ